MFRQGRRPGDLESDPLSFPQRSSVYALGYFPPRLLLDVVPNLGGGEVLAAGGVAVDGAVVATRWAEGRGQGGRALFGGHRDRRDRTARVGADAQRADLPARRCIKFQRAALASRGRVAQRRVRQHE